MTTTKFEKKEPKLIEVSTRPIIIVGERMGRQRPGEDRYALEGNRTGDFVHEAIKGKKNIILTNLVNYYYEGNFDPSKYVDEGIHDLLYMFQNWHPKKIICLGAISYGYVQKIYRPADCELKHMPHPSFINRFLSSQRGFYIQNLRNELN